MKAMVLAAGIGKRLLPFTKDMPKPLIEVGSAERVTIIN